MPYCDISDRAQMSKTIIAVKHFALGGRESLETAVIRAYESSGNSLDSQHEVIKNLNFINQILLGIKLTGLTFSEDPITIKRST